MKTKKIVFVLFAALLSLQVAAQQPIMDRKAEGYSIGEIQKLALGDSIKSQEYRKNLLDLVQTGLTRSGESVVITNSNISWIIKQLDSLPVEMVVPKGSINSGWNPNKKSIYFFEMENDWEGFVFVFRYGKCVLPLIKANCCNLLSVIKKTEVNKATYTIEANPTNPNPSNQPALGAPIINVNVTNTNTNDFGPLIEALKASQQPAAQPPVDLKIADPVIEKKQINPWIPAIIGGVVTLGTGTALYFLLRDKGGPVGAPGHDDGVLSLKFSF